MRVLIVEDDLNSRKVLTRMVSFLGESDFARNGRDAIELCVSAFADETPYDLIFLDIMMPEVDGQEALVEIRKLELENHRPNYAKIIMTSALSDTENYMQAINERCDGYLVKPITLSRLHEQLDQLGISQPE